MDVFPGGSSKWAMPPFFEFEEYADVRSIGCGDVGFHGQAFCAEFGHGVLRFTFPVLQWFPKQDSSAVQPGFYCAYGYLHCFFDFGIRVILNITQAHGFAILLWQCLYAFADQVLAFSCVQGGFRVLCAGRGDFLHAFWRVKIGCPFAPHRLRFAVREAYVHGYAGQPG